MRRKEYLWTSMFPQLLRYKHEVEWEQPERFFHNAPSSNEFDALLWITAANFAGPCKLFDRNNFI